MNIIEGEWDLHNAVVAGIMIGLLAVIVGISWFAAGI